MTVLSNIAIWLPFSSPAAKLYGKINLAICDTDHYGGNEAKKIKEIKYGKWASKSHNRCTKK